MKRVWPALMLFGCQPAPKDTGTMQMVAQHEMEIAQLQSEIRRLKEEDKFLSNQILDVAEAEDNLAAEVDANADAYNRHTH